jgi:hypothetical protein
MTKLCVPLSFWAVSFTVLCHSTARAQLDRYSVCDTIIESVHYNRCLYMPEVGVSALASVDRKGRLHGGWVEYGIGDSAATNVFGQYHRGKKDGEWIFRSISGEFLRSEFYDKGVPCGKWWVAPGEFIILDRRGDVISKGSGCRDCPPF